MERKKKTKRLSWKRTGVVKKQSRLMDGTPPSAFNGPPLNCQTVLFSPRALLLSASPAFLSSDPSPPRSLALFTTEQKKAVLPRRGVQSASRRAVSSSLKQYGAHFSALTASAGCSPETCAEPWRHLQIPCFYGMSMRMSGDCDGGRAVPACRTPAWVDASLTSL